jgi:ADP-heptose:LPS heptosyltransferase
MSRSAPKRDYRSAATEQRLQFAIANLGSALDVLLTTPLLEAIRKTHPSSRITTIVTRYAAQILDYSPFVNELMIWPDTRQKHRSGFSILPKIARRRFNAAVGFSSSGYLNLGFFLARTPVRIGMLPAAQAWTLTNRIDPSRLALQPHTPEYFLAAARDLGVEPPPTIKLHYTVRPTEKAAARMILNRWDVDPDKHSVIAIHTGTDEGTSNADVWPADHFAEVIRQVVVGAGHKVVLIGETYERDLGSKLGSSPAFRGLVDLTSRLSFREAAAVIGQSHLLMSNSLLPHYIAGALGIDVVQVQENHKRLTPPEVITAIDKRLMKMERQHG